MTEKTCTKCSGLKALSDFPKRKSSADGRRNECTACTRASKLEWDSQNRDKIRTYHIRWSTREGGNYKEVVRRANKSSYQRNPEMHKEYYRIWYRNNKDKAAIASKEWRERIGREYFRTKRAENSENINARNRLNYKADPGKNQAKTRAYQAKKSQALPLWVGDVELDKIKEFYRIAAVLSKVTGMRYHVDHYYPLNGTTVSGLHVPENLQIIPAATNLSKRNKHPDDFEVLENT